MSAGNGRVKRLHAEFRGDEAIDIEMLEIILRMGEVSRTPIESDTRLVRLALKSLQNAMTEYCRKTGRRYPAYVTLLKYLDETDDPEPVAPNRVISLPSATGSRGSG